MQNKGLIISNISNLYMVEDVDTKIIIKCNARGKLKEKNESPVVGDYVKISIKPSFYPIQIDEIF